MDRHYVKEGRDFVVHFEDGEVYIGTSAVLSNIAAQMLSHDVMKPLKWKSTGSCMDLQDKQGNYCVAVGYKVPRFCNPEKKIQLLFGN